MFLGHFGVGFGGKAAAPRVSLGTLFLAAQFVDLLWSTLLMLGIERASISPGNTRVMPVDFTSYPFSHSLLAVGLWATLYSFAYFLLRRYRKGAWVCGLVLLSHWVLDVLVHRPDLGLAPGSSFRVGLGLWNSVPATLVVELAIFAAGVGFYCRTTQPSDRTGSAALWVLVALLVMIYCGSIFGQPPPNVTALAWVGQAQWLFVVWGYWIDRHRKPNR